MNRRLPGFEGPRVGAARESVHVFYFRRPLHPSTGNVPLPIADIRRRARYKASPQTVQFLQLLIGCTQFFICLYQLDRPLFRLAQHRHVGQNLRHNQRQRDRGSHRRQCGHDLHVR